MGPTNKEEGGDHLKVVPKQLGSIFPSRGHKRFGNKY